MGDTGPSAGDRAAQVEPSAEDLTLVIGLERLPEGLDPLGALDAWGQRISEDLVFEGLVRRSTGGAPWVQMQLADRCEVDAVRATRRITCHLRSGQKFSDGHEIEVDDVLYSARYWLDPRRSTLRAQHGLSALRSVEAVDGPAGAPKAIRDPGRWIRFEFEQRDPLALEKLSEIKVVPRKLHRGREDRFAREPVGSGPMRVVSMSNERWVLERVEPEAGPKPEPGAATQDGTDRAAAEPSAELPSSPAAAAVAEAPKEAKAGAGQPALRRIVFREFTDGAAAITALRRAEIHILDRVAPSYVPEELGRPGMAARFRAWVTSPAAYDVLLFNTRRESSVGGNLRRALVSAVPRVALSRELYGGPGWGFDAPVDLEHPRELELEALSDVTQWPVGEAPGKLPSQRDPSLDVEGASLAADLLDQLGYRIERELRRRNDVNLRVTLTWDGRAGHATALAEAVRSSWRQLGISTPEAVASWAYLSNLMRKGQFSVALGRLASHQDADLYDYFHSRGTQNVSGVSDAALDEALVDYRMAEDAEGRRRAKADIAARLWATRAVAVLHAPAPVLVASRRVRGLEFSDDLPRLDRLSLAPRGSTEVWDLR